LGGAIATLLLCQTASVGKQLGALLPVEDWLSLALADKDLFATLSSHGFWLAFTGYELDGGMYLLMSATTHHNVYP
jgi:hypothetical protein